MGPSMYVDEEICFFLPGVLFNALLFMLLFNMLLFNMLLVLLLNVLLFDMGALLELDRFKQTHAICALNQFKQTHVLVQYIEANFVLFVVFIYC